MARKKASSDGDTGSWLNTYADMVTLLLTFFILLYSMSTMDPAKFNMLVRAIRSEYKSADNVIIVGTASGEYEGGIDQTGPEQIIDDIDLEALAKIIQEQINQADKEDSVQVAVQDDFIMLRFMDDMLFEPNSARLKASDLELLDFVGYAIKSIQDQVEDISIQGHTASVDYDNYPISDRQLSTERANAVLMHFEDNIGIVPKKLKAIGFGKQYPIVDNDSEENRAQNRRVEIFISTKNPIGEQMELAYEKLAITD